jgi:hypothetical protein
MQRQTTFDRLVTDGLALSDPTDRGIIEQSFKKDIREGEEKLMLAVLASAIEDFQNHILAQNDSEKKLFQAAEEWFLEKNYDWLFSFENICEVLELDPNYTRHGLLCWKDTRRNFQVTKRKVKKPASTGTSSRGRRFAAVN